jgi:uncharacterized protein (DUF1684 family)
MEGTPTDKAKHRAICVSRRDRADGSDAWIYLKVTSPEADSLTYTVLFPHGIEGWFEKDDAWHKDIPRIYTPTRVLKRRRAARATLNFIDEEAIDDDAPPPSEPDDPDAPQTSRRKARRSADLKTYTLLNYYQWNTSYRPETPNIIANNPETANFFSAQHHGGKLFQQYCVDAFSKIEENRLDAWRDPKMQFKQHLTVN